MCMSFWAVTTLKVPVNILWLAALLLRILILAMKELYIWYMDCGLSMLCYSLDYLMSFVQLFLFENQP